MSFETKSWENPVGFWEVTTESDCEGRGVRRLGIFNGHYCDIAVGLANQACYSLYFRKVSPEEMIPPTRRTRDKVQITFSDYSKENTENMVKDMNAILNPIEFSVEKGMYNGHVLLHFPDSEGAKKAKAIEAAKAKLTPEELKLLGLA